MYREKPFPIDMFYPYYNGRKIQKAIKKIFPKDGSNQWIGEGEIVKEFEKKFAEKFNLPYCLMTNSGTSALWLAYDLCNIKEGDEVIVPILTCTLGNIPLLHKKAKIIFADIRQDNLTIDPDDVEKKITKKTKAIVGTTLGGMPLSEKLFKIGKKYKIPVVVDSAQSLGYNKGDYIMYSFQAIKFMTTCDGGMLVTRNKKDHTRARLLRWAGIDREQKAKKNWKAWERRAMTFDIKEPGYKFQPTNLTAMLGLVGLEDIDKIMEHRKRLVEMYKWQLEGVPGIKLLNDEGSTHWLFGILADNRDELAEELEKVGIGTNMVHLRNDLFTIFKPFKNHCPNMDIIHEKYLYLPLHNRLSEKDVFGICQAIKNIQYSLKK